MSLYAQVGFAYRLSEQMSLTADLYMGYGINEVTEVNDGQLLVSNGNADYQYYSPTTYSATHTRHFGVKIGLLFGGKKKPGSKPVNIIAPTSSIIIEQIPPTVSPEALAEDTLLMVDDVEKLPTMVHVDTLPFEVQEVFRPESILNDTLIFQAFTYPFNAVSPLEKDFYRLDKMVKMIQKNKVTLQIEGYSDVIGAVAACQLVSERRAKYIYDYFVNKGLNPEALSYQGHGKNGLKKRNAQTAEEHAINRRVVVTVLREK